MRIALFLGLLALVSLCVTLAYRSLAVTNAASELLQGMRARQLSFATLFLLYGLVAVFPLALLMPPYQAADEGAHFLRADDVELGHPLGYRSGANSGGTVDQGIAASYGIFYPIVLHPENKATAAMFDRAAVIGWKSNKSFSDFANTSIYPPLFYSVSALAIAIGKVADLPVTSTLTLARMFNGVVGVGLGASSIALAGMAGPWFFVLLTLPMTLAQMASASQDALLFPTAAVAAALFIRLLRGESSDIGGFALLCVLLAVVSTGRFTYGTLALLPLTLHRVSLLYRVLGALAVAAAAIGWSWIASSFALVQFGLPGANASGQVRHILAQPWSVFDLAVNTVKYQYDLYLESFVGKLGWLDVRLPWLYLALAWGVILLGILTSVTVGALTRRAGAVTGIVSFALLASAAALFAALYISWTPVGNFIVDGVQGRYFIPLAFFVPALLATGPRSLLGRSGGAAKIVIASFPLLTIPVLITSIVMRYYQG